MKDIRTLVNIVSKNKLKQIELLPGKASNGSLVKEFYDGITEDRWDNEEEAAEYFYRDSEYKSVYFNRLKRQLKDRLINSLFIIDVNQPQYTKFQRAYYECFKNLAAVKILLGRYARQPAIDLAERTLKQAMHFEFTDVILELAKLLRFHYGTISGDKTKYREYNSIVKKHLEIYNAEIKAEELYTDLIVEFVNSRGSQPGLIEKAKRYYRELRELTRKLQSYRLNFVSYVLFTLRFEAENDYENTLKVCEEALDYFRSQSHLASNSVVHNFQAKIIAGCIHLRRFGKAQKAAEKCLEIALEGSRNWYVTLDYYMLLYFHSGQFQKAFETYRTATEHPSFNQQQKNIIEHWYVYGAFVYYFIYNGKIKPVADSPLKKFRISKFLNEVPTYSKDKRGTNISILILHVLFLLQQGKYGQIIDRMEALKTYSHRYLRKDDTFRSNCFIKMLLTLPAASFNKTGVLRKARKYWDKLKSVPIDKAKQSTEIEIVPYEMLWDLVLDSLDERFH